jgi:hypothetical protein
VRSVDWEHGTRIDQISPAPTTYPKTQVGYDTVLVMCKENECCQSINVCINNDTKGINPIFLVQIKNKPHNEMHMVCLFLNWLRP